MENLTWILNEDSNSPFNIVLMENLKSNSDGFPRPNTEIQLSLMILMALSFFLNKKFANTKNIF